MKTYPLAGLLTGIVALAPLPAAHAAPVFFWTVLTPEVTGATGSGSAIVALDPVANTLSLSTNWSGLSGTTTVAHIHCCVAPPGIVGIATTTPTLVGFPTGVSAGSFSTTLDTGDNSTFSAAFRAANGGTNEGAEAALLAGLTAGRAYLNIHSTLFPPGEIRGFFQVPAPMSLALLAAGLAGLVVLRRRAG